MRAQHEHEHNEWHDHGYRRNSVEWVHYFMHNQKHLMPHPWDDAYELSRNEIEAIGKSMATFQLGESSEGNHFISAGRRYIETSGDARYMDALKLFIAEENRHGMTLGRFMLKHHIPLKRKEWTDSIFRLARKLGELDLCISILVAAELIAKAYYTALRDATESPLLKGICEQILRDEKQHIYFQSSTLGRLRIGYSSGRIMLAEYLHRFLMLGTVVVVWAEHKSVFKAGGWKFMPFVRICFEELEDSLRIIRWQIMRHAADGLATLKSASTPALAS